MRHTRAPTQRHTEAKPSILRAGDAGISLIHFTHLPERSAHVTLRSRLQELLIMSTASRSLRRLVELGALKAIRHQDYPIKYDLWGSWARRMCKRQQDLHIIPGVLYMKGFIHNWRRFFFWGGSVSWQYHKVKNNNIMLYFVFISYS